MSLIIHRAYARYCDRTRKCVHIHIDSAQAKQLVWGARPTRGEPGAVGLIVRDGARQANAGIGRHRRFHGE